MADVVIDSYRLAYGPSSVKAEIRAADAVGFLGRILRVFARFALFPWEMTVDTRGSEIVDVFSLQTKEGAVPCSSVVARLDDRLRQLCSGGRT